jgi:ankyrin repeat protein
MLVIKEKPMKEPNPQAVIKALYTRVRKTLEKYTRQHDINYIDSHGDSLLTWAITGMDLNMYVIRLLIRWGADINIRLREGVTLLHYAAHSLHKDLVIELLQAGCNSNAVNDFGHTPLIEVLWTYNPKANLIELLLRHGADPHLKPKGGESALEIAKRTGQLSLFPSEWRQQSGNSGAEE